MRAKSTTSLAVAAAILLLAAGPAGAQPDDAKRAAAEHFSLGEAAEKREDWRAAIAEFKLAYEAKPHHAPLYKIAKDYERLEDWRSAADYYEQYLAENPAARDRDKLAAKIDELRARADAAMPDPRSTQGLLVVHSNVDGAQVIVDGQVLGQTPFEGAVAAGPHRVDVTLDGYTPQERSVQVPAGGSEQIRALLIAKAVEPERRGGWLIGFGYGVDFTQTATRYVLSFGGRLPGERFEAGFDVGLFGPNDAGVGLSGRVYFSTGKVRPYARAGVSIGKTTSGISEARTFGAEAGGGVLFTPFSNLRPGQRSSVEYFVELSGRYTTGGLDDDTDTANDVSTFLLPIQGGLVVRFR